MIDLHIHTNASDGTWTPAEVVREARQLGLDTISITDHDTFDAYAEAVPAAAELGVNLLWGVEISTRLAQPGRPYGKSIHILGYFPKGPSAEFREWVAAQHESRRERNAQLAAKLQKIGIDVTLEEVESRGRNMAGRPHFARIMLEKGYVGSIQEAFDEYLDERGKAYVEKHEPSVAEGIRHIRDGGGVASLAHPIKLNKFGTQEEDLIRQLAKMGMQAIEVYHPEQTERHQERYALMARRYDLAITGGTDFHGDNKPGVRIGSGKGGLAVPNKVLDRIRILARG